ncbi:hypothetical protein [Pseudomonas sp. RT6P73]
MAASGLFLFRPSGSVIAPLQNRPLLIAGAVEPIVDGDAGINISVVEDHPDGVLCAVNKYSPPVQAGDQIDVYWDGEKIFHKEVQPEEVDNDFLFFFLPVALMVPGWVEQVYYVLTRQGETVPDDPSAALRVLVKLDRPGGPDKEPQCGWHSELHIAQLPRDAIENGIDAEWAKNGVPVTIPIYPGIHRYDVIILHWGSVRIPHTVTAQQAAGEDPIIILVDQDAILAGGDSAALTVRYFPHDQVWNWAAKHSKGTAVLVDAGAWRLESPIINNAVNGVITLKDLNQEDVTVLVKITINDYDLGDTVKMTWIGTPAVGKPLIYTQSRVVDNIPTHLEFKVPYAQVRAIAMGTADASYVLTKLDNSRPLSSKREFADVIGDVSILPAPRVEQVVGATLEPDNEYATVCISYPGMASGDYLNLIWLGTQANGQTYLHEEQHTVSSGEAADKLVMFYVDGQHIAVLDKGSLDLSYRVSNDAAALYGISESERLLLKVEQLRATLPVAVVLEADPPDVLDPSKVFHNVNVRVDYLGTLPGDILTCHWSGNGPFGSTTNWVPITTVSAGKPVTFRVAAEFVTANIGKYVKVRYTVKRAATGLYSYSVTLNLLVAALIAPTLDTVTDSKGLISQGGITFDRSVTVTGSASPDQKIRLLDGATALDEATADRNGDWTLVVNELTAKAYSLKALALYGNGEESPPRTFTVAVAVTPTIDSVTDSKGPVAQGGITFDRSVTVTGKASPDQKIRLLDSATALDEATADRNGDWTLVVNELTTKAYSLKALALYGNGEESPPRTFTVAVAVTPTIDSVTDSKGPVAQGGITFDRSVTVTGKASPNQKVRLRDSTTTLGEPIANDSGTWTQVVSALTVKGYSLKALALYGNGEESPPRTFTVAVAVQPTIDSVTDSKGPVAQGGITFDRSVTVTGKASPDQKIRLLDGATALDEAIANDSGTWTQVVSALTVKGYSLKALALYGNGEESPPRTFTVAVAVQPTIDSVTDSKGPVAQGGITFDRSVTVTGKASPNQKVRLRDSTTTLGEPIANDSGTWTQVVSALTVKGYSLKALALYGNGEESPPRTFTVAVAVQPTIDSVTDSKGPVAQGGITFDRSVTVTGKASPNQKVRLRDSTTALGEPIANDSGTWTQVVSALTVKGYSLKALALYGNGEESPPRTFTVAVAVQPTIDSVTDSKGPVAQGGITFDRSVTVTGKASPNQKVRLRDSTTALGEPIANDSGTWTQVVSALTVKGYSLKALALYGDGDESTPPRTFTVESWVDSVTDFTNGTSGNWLKGPAGYQGRVTGGMFRNLTTAVSGHSGVLFSQTFRLITGKTYSFSYQARNHSPQPENVAPSFSVRFASGQSILPVYNVPRTNLWYTQTNNFTVTQSGNHQLQIISHQDRGGNGGSDGGNDYDIDNIIVRLVG